MHSFFFNTNSVDMVVEYLGVGRCGNSFRQTVRVAALHTEANQSSLTLAGELRAVQAGCGDENVQYFGEPGRFLGPSLNAFG